MSHSEFEAATVMSMYMQKPVLSVSFKKKLAFSIAWSQDSGYCKLLYNIANREYLNDYIKMLLA